MRLNLWLRKWVDWLIDRLSALTVKSHPMRVIASLLAAATLALALAACGSSGHDTASSGAPTTAVDATDSKPATQTAEQPATVDSLAAKLGCADVQAADKAIAATSGMCTLPNGHRVEIATFAGNEARDQYLELGSQVAPDAAFVKGDRWSAGGPHCTQEDLAPLA